MSCIMNGPCSAVVSSLSSATSPSISSDQLKAETAAWILLHVWFTRYRL
jgi:hypothetical protein